MTKLIPDKVIQDLENFLKESEENVVEIIKQNAHIIEDMQTAQMEQGIDRDGKPIAPPYRPFTVQIKRMKGQPTDRVMLKDTGDFHRSVKVFPSTKAFSIGATDEKTQKIERKYSSDIFGLTDDNMQEIIDDYTGPGLKEKLDDILKQITR